MRNPNLKSKTRFIFIWLVLLSLVLGSVVVLAQDDDTDEVAEDTAAESVDQVEDDSDDSESSSEASDEDASDEEETNAEDAASDSAEMEPAVEDVVEPEPLEDTPTPTEEPTETPTEVTVTPDALVTDEVVDESETVDDVVVTAVVTDEVDEPSDDATAEPTSETEASTETATDSVDAGDDTDETSDLRPEPELVELWRSDGKLIVTEGDAVIPVYDENLFQVAVEAELSFDNGVVGLVVRRDGERGYSVELDANGSVSLFRNDELLAETELDGFAPEDEHDLRLSAMSGILRVSVDGAEVIALLDDDALPAGSVILATSLPDDAELEVDEIVVYVPEGSVPTEPAPTDTPDPTDVPEVVVTAEVTAEATQTIAEDSVPVIVPDIVVATPETTPEPTTEVTVEAEVTAEPTADATAEATVEVELTAEPTAEATVEAEVTAEPTAEVTVEATEEAEIAEVEVEATAEATEEADVVALAVVEEPAAAMVSAPAAPNLISPADGSYTLDMTPLFDWDAVSGANRYRMEVATDQSFTNIVVSATDTDTPDTKFTIADALDYGTYYWRAAARNADEVWGDYSTPNKFFITPMIKPVDGEVSQNLTRKFVWELVDGATRYRLQVDNDSDLSSPFINQEFDNTTRKHKPTLPSTGIYYWRLQVDTGSGFEDAPIWMFTITDVPLAPPTLNEPVKGSRNATTTPQFTWNTVAGASSYDLQVDNNGDFSSPVEFDGLSGTSFTPSDDLPEGKLFWRMRTENGLGVSGEWSSKIKFFIDTNAPAQVALKKPEGTTSNPQPKFKWQTLDEAVQYQFQLTTADDPTYSSPVLDELIAGDVNKFKPADPLAQDDFLWRVRAQDRAGNWGNWREFALTINIGVSPGDGDGTTEATPTFRWSTVADATSYCLVMDDNADFGSPLMSQGGITLNEYVLPAGMLTSYGEYYWQVQVDGCGSILPVSNMFIYTETPPASPDLIAPANGFNTNDATPTFEWSEVTDVSDYEIELSSDGDFINSTIMQVTGTTYTPGSDLTDGKMFWRVRSLSDVGAPGPWSGRRKFKVDTTPPIAPTIKKPTDVANNAAPKLKWTAVTGVAQYQVQVTLATDTTYANPIVDTPVDGTVNKYKPDPLAQDSYRWRVRSLDGAGNPSEWVEATFDLSIARTPIDNFYTTDPTPEFLWSATSGVTGYCLQIATDEAFNNLVHNFNINNPDINLYELTNDQKLSEFGSYYWRVMLNYGAGCVDTPFYRMLTVTTTPLDAPNVTAPSKGAQINTDQPTIEWDAVPSAIGYDIELSRSSDFTDPITGSVAGTSFTPSETLEDGKWFARVRTRNVYNAPGDWTGKVKFFVDTLEPVAPLLKKLNNGDTTTDNTPKLKWRTIEDATRYEVQLDTDNPPQVLRVNTASNKWNPPEPLLMRDYAWRVRSLDDAGNVSEWSEIREFAVESSDEASPVLNRNSNDQVTLQWTPISWSTAYHIQVDNHEDFSSPIFEDDNIDPANTSVTTGALYDGTWYWRVRAKKDDGTWGEWSVTGTFTVDDAS